MSWEDVTDKVVDKVIEKGVEEGLGVKDFKTVKAVAETGMAAGAAVSAATGLTVAATSGAGITSGLAAAGSVGRKVYVKLNLFVECWCNCIL
ncbi:hypothetical protein [Trichormus sp. NMC-1]|uniref:hypothetical protein n=1 Tax=Trichormus sp. NMC-1 TaxID=1853259 RepID=UPI0008DC0214|nr:hypothetical protein [Trichormus sp. NMC-1]